MSGNEVVVQDMFDTLLLRCHSACYHHGCMVDDRKEEDEPNSSNRYYLCIWYRMLTAWNSWVRQQHKLHKGLPLQPLLLNIENNRR